MRRRAPVQRVLAAVACSSCLAAHSSQAASAPPAGGSSASGGSGGWMRIPDHHDDGHSSYSADPSLVGFSRGQPSNGNCHPVPPNIEASDRPYYTESGPTGAPLPSSESPTRHGYSEPSGIQEQEQLYYNPRNIPQHTGWIEHRDAGASQQQYQPPPPQQQHPQHPQQHPQGQHHSFYAGPGASSPQASNGEPLKLGTKLRGIVSRVRGTVRPGQSAGLSQSGYHPNASGSYPSGGYPPGSTWSSGVPHGADYAQQGAYGQSDPYPFRAEHGRPGDYYHPAEQGGYNQGGGQGATYGRQQDTPHATYIDDHRPTAPAQQGQVRGADQEIGKWPQPPHHFQPDGDRFYGSDMTTAGEETYPNSHVVNVDHSTAYGEAPRQRWEGVGMEASPGFQSRRTMPQAQDPQEGTYDERPMLGEGWTTVSPTSTESVPAHPDPGRESHPSDSRAARDSMPHDFRDEFGSTGSGSVQREKPPAPLVSRGASDVATPMESESRGDEPRPSSFAGHPAWISGRPTMVAGSGTDENARVDRRGEDAASVIVDDGDVVGLSPLEMRESPEADTVRGKTYVPLERDAHDAMQASADHGLEEVDWGDEAEDLYEPAVAVGAFDGPDDKDEEALIRELERMDAIGGVGSGAMDAGGADLKENSEGDADEAVEQTLDILFNSIKDEEEGAGDDGRDGDPAIIHDRGSAATAETPGADFVDGTGEQRQSPRVPAGWDGLADGTVDEPANPEGYAADTSIRNHENNSSESLWGNTRRWETLPVVVSVAEGAAEAVAGLDDNWGGSEGSKFEEQEVPLDPIDLPPAAATDGVWNDEHLQDQLDAYWEQSRRASEHAGGLATRDQQQLGRYGQYLEPIYGPGDWVGKGAERAAMMQEPLPAPERSIVQNDLGIPNLFQGNQAPINIYGNIYVGNAEARHRDGANVSPLETNPRDRYLPRAETSWSGNE